MNKIARAVYDASKDGDIVKASIRLRKNGHFSSVEGTVEDVRVSRDGFPYVVFEKQDGWQNVRLTNIRSITKNGRTIRNS